MAMTIERYFHIVFNILNRYWAVVYHETVWEIFSAKEGHIRSRVTFLDASCLEFEEFVQIDQADIRWRYYKYHYIKDGQSVFRYDNYPRHPGISPPYHHKHISSQDRVLPVATKPKLIEVIEEITRQF